MSEHRSNGGTMLNKGGTLAARNNAHSVDALSRLIDTLAFQKSHARKEEAYRSYTTHN